MRINDIANDIFNKASKAYKKPVPVKIEGPILHETFIRSWENDQLPVHRGDYIITGIKGEKYPISSTVFHEYERAIEAGENMYKKKMKIVYAYQVDFKGTVITSQNKMLEFQPGYYIVMESPENMWAVEENVFKESYVFI